MASPTREQAKELLALAGLTHSSLADGIFSGIQSIAMAMQQQVVQMPVSPLRSELEAKLDQLSGMSLRALALGGADATLGAIIDAVAAAARKSFTEKSLAAFIKRVKADPRIQRGEALDLANLDLSIETVEERISPSETNVFDK